MEAFDGQERYITGVSISLASFATSLVATRIVSIYYRRGWLGREEVMVMLSNTFLIVITVVACLAVQNGFGLRGEDIEAAGGNRQRALQYFYLFQIFYKLVICFNKLAFLLLYLRVFQFSSFRPICLASIIVVIASSFSFILATILECIPVAKNWDKSLAGHCIANAPFRWSWAGVNTLTDVWVSMLPAPFIQRLQMNRAKRAGLAVLFALGLFVCAASGIRMKAMVQSTRARRDPTWDSAPAFLWSYVEASVGLVCTCLPSLRWLLARVIPRLASSKQGGSASRKRGGAGAGAGAGGLDLPQQLEPYRLSRVERERERRLLRTVSAAGGTMVGAESRECIVEGAIHVKTSVSVRSSNTSAEASD